MAGAFFTYPLTSFLSEPMIFVEVLPGRKGEVFERGGLKPPLSVSLPLSPSKTLLVV